MGKQVIGSHSHLHESPMNLAMLLGLPVNLAVTPVKADDTGL